MKKFILLFTSFILSYSVQAQNKKTYWDNLKPVYLSLSTIDIDDKHLPFSKIEIIDQRQDPNCFAYEHTGAKAESFSYVNIDKNPIESLEKFFRKQFLFNDTENVLIMVPKVLWLDFSEQDSVNSRKDVLTHTKKYGVFVDVDFFIKKNKAYYFLQSIKGIYDFKWKLGYTKRSKMLSTAIAQMIIDVKNKYNKNDSLAITNLPKTIETNTFKVPQKGVYTSYKDFVNNNPTYINYKILSSSTIDCIVVHNNDTLCNNVFAICDTTNAYIYYDNNFFKMSVFENSVKVYRGNKIIERKEFFKIMKIIPLATTIYTSGLIGLATDKAISELLEPLFNKQKKLIYRPSQYNYLTGKFTNDLDQKILKLYE
jgi:hypothetical protein